ncbi:potassium channel family protein [Nitratifractor sp.]
MALHRLSERNNFLYLLGALTALLFSSAIADDLPEGIGEDLFSIISVVMLIVGIRSLRPDLAMKRIVYTMVGVLGLLTLIWRLYPSQWSALLILLVFLLIFVGAFKLSMHRILFEGRVDGNKIIGSLSLYLLLGLIWTVLYLILLLFDPGSFNGIEITEWRTAFSRVAYYSFVTLTTLGYGDISPRTHIGEFLAYMEAVVGVFYMAIFVSSLINLRGNARDDGLEG